MKTQLFRYVTIFVSVLLLIPSCAPLPTPASQPNSPSQPNTSSSNNSSGSNTDWQQFLTVEPFVGCVGRLLPIAVNTSGDPAQQIADTNPIADVRKDWAIVPINSSAILFYLTNTGNHDWVELNKSLNVSVSTNSKVSKHADVVELVGCGGTNQIREFPSINLRSDLNNFTQKSTFAGADYFTLQPGEFEVFKVNFKCETTGYYKVSPTVEYSYQGEKGIIEFPEFNVLCPESFTVYTMGDINSLSGVESYMWENGEYSLNP